MDKFQIPLLTFIGVLLSTSISYIIGRKTAQISEKNLQLSKESLDTKLKEIKETYSKSIHTERIKVYPLLYIIISKFGKLYRECNEKLSLNQLNSFLNDLINWDENYSLFVGEKVLRGIFLTRRTTEHIIKTNKQNYINLFQHICFLEYELKKEIGVFSSESFSELQQKNITELENYNRIFEIKYDDEK